MHIQEGCKPVFFRLVKCLGHGKTSGLIKARLLSKLDLGIVHP